MRIRRQDTNIICIYGETGRFPLVMRQEDRALKLWLRLKFSKENKPINNVFYELENLQNLGYDTWLTKIRTILGTLYNNVTDIENSRRLLSDLKEKRYRLFMEKLLIDIKDHASNPKLRSYCLFKIDYRKEPYLHYVTNRNFLTAISRFRTSSHSLHIETGRHTLPYTPVDNRICTFCNSNKIDDEMHMLLKCTFHNSDRKILFQNIQPFLQYPISEYNDLDLFCSVMKLKYPESLIAIGKYLYTGFTQRKNTSIDNT